MSLSIAPSPSRRGPGLAALGVACALVALFATSAAAQILKPWSPPGDTLSPLAHSARLRFERQQGDSVTGPNYDGYQIVGQLGQGLLTSLGRAHLAQAKAIEGTLDSLGLDVQVATDPDLPHVVFMLVRNPFHRASQAVGYFYWLTDKEVRMEGVTFPPAHDVRLRAWLTGRASSPYAAMLLYQREGEKPALAMRLFRMDPNAQYWELIQYDGHGPEFSPGARASFADVNTDGLPELVVFERMEPDSFLEIRSGMPPVVREYVYTERPEGFVLHDLRSVPGPMETLRLFTLMLADKQYDRARRLLVKPASLDTLLKLGWGRHTERGAWTVEYGEPEQQWPEWVEVRVHQDSGFKRWIVHFWIEDGRWVIKNWIPVQPARNAVRVDVPPADTTGTRRK